MLNRVRHLSPEERRRGLITISAGNHAAALAWSAHAEGVPCTGVMPEDAAPAKVAVSRSYGAEIVLHGSVGEAFAECFRLRDERDLTFVHPFDAPLVIAGGGTVGLGSGGCGGTPGRGGGAGGRRGVDLGGGGRGEGAGASRAGLRRRAGGRPGAYPGHYCHK